MGQDYTFFYTEKTPTTEAIECGEKGEKSGSRSMSLCWFRRTQRRLHPQGSAFDSQYLELDVYTGESRRAIVEIKSAAGETEARLPVEVKLIWEVTGERGFSNHAIALNRGGDCQTKMWQRARGVSLALSFKYNIVCSAKGGWLVRAGLFLFAKHKKQPLENYPALLAKRPRHMLFVW